MESIDLDTVIFCTLFTAFSATYLFVVILFLKRK